MDWDEAGFIQSGQKRKAVFLSLDKPRTPTDISRIADVRVSNVWQKLKDLEDKGFVECMNPQAKKGRLYARTKKGEKIFKQIQG